MKNKSFLSSLKYASKGIKTVFFDERNFRFDLIMCTLVVICSFIFPLLKWERCVVWALCALCLFAECTNSAIEALVDLASPSFHPLAGRAKDIAAGAALICAIFAAVIGLYIFIPYGVEFLKETGGFIHE
ncbi:MAG: diacylglycerol kinase family protein [Clostridia bacterium]|nr:diacylglycerol kinase family protein [Clostridia bacterium]